MLGGGRGALPRHYPAVRVLGAVGLEESPRPPGRDPAGACVCVLVRCPCDTMPGASILSGGDGEPRFLCHRTPQNNGLFGVSGFVTPDYMRTCRMLLDRQVEAAAQPAASAEAVAAGSGSRGAGSLPAPRRSGGRTLQAEAERSRERLPGLEPWHHDHEGVRLSPPLRSVCWVMVLDNGSCLQSYCLKESALKLRSSSLFVRPPMIPLCAQAIEKAQVIKSAVFDGTVHPHLWIGSGSQSLRSAVELKQRYIECVPVFPQLRCAPVSRLRVSLHRVAPSLP